MKAIAQAIAPKIELGLLAKVAPLIPDFKPYLIATALIAGLLMANMVVVRVWQIVTCNC